jgi:hypothetical protein
MPKEERGAWLEIPFDVAKKEPLRLLLVATKSSDFGRYVVTLNGVKLGGELDFFNATIASEEFHLLDFWPEPGHYTLRLECVGRNPRSQGCYCGVESVRLRERRPRVARYAFDRDRDWRANPTLY